MQMFKKRVLAVAVAAALIPLVSHAEVTTLLQGKAEYWQSHGRDDLAAQNWRLELQADPNNAQALGFLALYALKEGKPEDAHRYLLRLEKAEPTSREIPMIKRAMALGTPTLTQLRKAAEATASGRDQKALSIYESLFQGGVPPMPYAKTYYLLLAKTPAGYREAIRQIRGYLGAHSTDYEYTLLLARLLSHSQPNRPEAFRLFEHLARVPSMSAEIRPYWRSALQWSGTSAYAIAPLRAYLAVYDDGALSEQLAQAQSIAASQRAAKRIGGILKRSFGALHSGHIGVAEQGFQDALRQYPHDSAALSGLASVRMVQRDYARAAALYEKAAKGSSSDKKSLLEAHREAQFLFELQQASRDGRTDSTAAMAHLKKALAIKPNNQAALAQIAALAAKLKQYPRAVSLYRRLLALEPQNIAAWMGLVGALNAEGKTKEALSTLSSIPYTARAKMQGSEGYVRLRASLYASDGQLGKAVKSLQSYAHSHSDKQMIDLKIQLAWYLYNAHRDGDLHRLLTRINNHSTVTADQFTTLSHLYQYAAQREANSALSKHDPKSAVTILRTAVSRYPHDADMKRALANVYLQMGQADQAHSIFVEVGPDHTAPNYAEAIGACIGSGDLERAAKWVRAAKRLWPNDPRILYLSAKVDDLQGHTKKALRAYRQTLSRLPAPSAAATDASATGADQYPFAGARRRPITANAGVPSGMDGAQVRSIRDDAKRSVAKLSQSSRASVGGFIAFGNRSGSNGFDALSVTSVGVSGRKPSQIGVITAQAATVTASSSDSASLPKEAAKFGAQSLRGNGAQPSSGQSYSGSSFRVGFSTPRWGVQVGHTPSAFPVSHPTFKLWATTSARSGIRLTLSQQPVKDSIVSYSGAVDPVTHRTWGGVIADSVGLSGDTTRGKRTSHFGISVQRLRGEGVESNLAVKASAGMSWLNSDPITGDRLRYGVQANYMHYRNNQSNLTLGSGGYFSPQQYFALSLPVSLTGDLGPGLSYAVDGSLGVQSFTLGAAPYFPLDPGFQSQARKSFGPKRVTGMTYRIGGHLDYKATANLRFGAGLQTESASGYSDTRGRIYLKYLFGDSRNR